MFEIRKTFHAETARYLPQLPAEHPCSRLHGHSFRITLVIRCALDPHLEWTIDYGDIDKFFLPILNKIDHNCLNEVQGLQNPTTEILCQWLYNEVHQVFPHIYQVIVSETQDTECRYPIQD